MLPCSVAVWEEDDGKVTVNADNPKLRENRLKLLSEIRDAMHSVADFSRVEG